MPSDPRCEGKISTNVRRADNLLLSVLDETIKQVFNETGTKIIYDYLRDNCHLNREEIAEKPDVFSTALDKLLGSAAPVIEKLILKNFYREFGLEYEEKEGYAFSDYVRELRKRRSR